MILCNNHCIPCCDFCKHVVHGNLEKDGTTEPIYCEKYNDDYHNELAEWCGYCDDFYCILADKEDKDG